jgi:hypothetical protein
MSYSYTIVEAQTFTVTHARHMAAKVATDLKRLQRFYNSPSDADIVRYEAEVIEFLKGGYLGTITYGFRRDGNWIEPTTPHPTTMIPGASVTGPTSPTPPSIATSHIARPGTS